MWAVSLSSGAFRHYHYGQEYRRLLDFDMTFKRILYSRSKYIPGSVWVPAGIHDTVEDRRQHATWNTTPDSFLFSNSYRKDTSACEGLGTFLETRVCKLLRTRRVCIIRTYSARMGRIYRSNICIRRNGGGKVPTCTMCE